MYSTTNTVFIAKPIAKSKENYDYSTCWGIKERTGGGKKLLHEKMQTGSKYKKNTKKIVKRSSSVNRQYRVSQPYDRMDHRNYFCSGFRQAFLES